MGKSLIVVTNGNNKENFNVLAEAYAFKIYSISIKLVLQAKRQTTSIGCIFFSKVVEQEFSSASCSQAIPLCSHE